MSEKKTFWSDAARDGLIMGVVLSVIMIISTYFQDSVVAIRALLSLLQITTIVLGLIYMGRQRGMKCEKQGLEFRFVNAMGYFIALMLFAGFIVGIAMIVLYKVLIPDLIDNLIAQAIHRQGIDPNSDPAVLTSKIALMLFNSPIFLVLAGIFAMEFYGILFGLFIAPFIKKEPNLFQNNNEQ